MRATISLLLVAQALLLAACAVSTTDQPSAPRATPAPPTYRPGVGVVESASVVSLSSSSPSATGGGTAGAPSGPTMAYRIKMEDGSTQSIVRAGERFELGERVEITSGGRLMRR